MAVLVSAPTIPSTILAANVPATMRNGRWKVTATSTYASPDATLPYGFMDLFNFTAWGSGAGDIYLENDTAGGVTKVYVPDGAGGYYLTASFTASASQAVTFEFDWPNGRIGISGATTGNGYHTVGSGSAITIPSGDIRVGQYDAVSFPDVYTGTFSDIEDFTSSSVTGTGAATWSQWVGAASGGLENAGTGAGVWSQWTGAAAGEQTNAGTGAGAWSSWVAAGSGGLENAGSGAATWSQWVGAGAGNSDATISGTGATPTERVLLEMANVTLPTTFPGSHAGMRVNGTWQFSFTPSFSSASMTNGQNAYLFGFDALDAYAVRLEKAAGVAYFDLLTNGVISGPAISWSAGQTITAKLENATGNITIAGATTGNGTTAGSAPFAPPSSTLFVGQDYANGNFFAGTISSVVDPRAWAFEASGVGSVPLVGAAAGAWPSWTAAASGELTNTGTADGTWPAWVGSAVGAVAPVTTVGEAAASWPQWIAAAAGEVFWQYAVYAPEGKTYPDDQGVPIDDDGKTVRRSERLNNAILSGALLTYDDEILDG